MRCALAPLLTRSFKRTLIRHPSQRPDLAELPPCLLGISDYSASVLMVPIIPLCIVQQIIADQRIKPREPSIQLVLNTL